MLIRSAPGSGPALPELHRRLRWLVAGISLVFALLLARLWQLQVVRGHEYYRQTLSNAVKKRYLASIRGRILDRNGVPLADNRPAFSIYVSPKTLDDVQSDLVRLLGLTGDEITLMQKRMDEARERGVYTPVMVLKSQSDRRAALVEQARFRLPGVEVHTYHYRHYPFGDLAAHLLGYMNKMTPEELEVFAPQGYGETELVGRDGVERAWQDQLHGDPGFEFYVENARGERIKGQEAERLIEGRRLIAPEPGHDVVLTIDVELQKRAEQAAGRHPAAAVAVVEVDTGRILALVSKPSYDPNVMTGHLSRAEKAVLDSDPRKPFIDKTLQQHYPPGSLYKFVTAVAALEGDVIGENTKRHCPGWQQLGRRIFHCHGIHGNVAMREALQQSCNVYFWHLADLVGIDKMAEVSRDFGFGTATGLGLNGDVSGRVPTRAWYEERTTFKPGYVFNTAIGQGDVEVTVLQVALAYAALANGGTLYVPQVVLRVQRPSGRIVMTKEPQIARRVHVSPRTLAVIYDGMYRVVNRPGGTAYYSARSNRTEIAGKTGTAQVRGKRGPQQVELEGWHPQRDHAWFAGWAPAKRPEIAVVVLIEHGGAGGAVAGPVARDIFEAYLAPGGGSRTAAAGAGK